MFDGYRGLSGEMVQLFALHWVMGLIQCVFQFFG